MFNENLHKFLAEVDGILQRTVSASLIYRHPTRTILIRTFQRGHNLSMSLAISALKTIGVRNFDLKLFFLHMEN